MFNSSPRVVLCHGVFDLLHYGHLVHLERARALGDRLVVSVLADEFALKRPPVYTQYQRMRLLQSLKCVDIAFLCCAPGPEDIIKKLRPAVYARGSEYAGKEMPESALLRELGIPVYFTTSVPPHTQDIIQRILHAQVLLDAQRS